MTQANGALTVVDPQPPSTPSADLLGDLSGPLTIEGLPSATVQPEPNLASGLEGGWNAAADALAIAPVEEQSNIVQVHTSCVNFLLFMHVPSSCYSGLDHSNVLITGTCP